MPTPAAKSIFLSHEIEYHLCPYSASAHYMSRSASPRFSCFHLNRLVKRSLTIYFCSKLAAEMDASNPSQQDSWQSNVYVINTTRVLIALGSTFLIRSAYQLFQRMRSSRGIRDPQGMSRASSCCSEDIPTDYG